MNVSCIPRISLSFARGYPSTLGRILEAHSRNGQYLDMHLHEQWCVSNPETGEFQIGTSQEFNVNSDNGQRHVLVCGLLQRSWLGIFDERDE